MTHTSAFPLADLLPCSTSILHPLPNSFLAAPSAWLASSTLLTMINVRVLWSVLSIRGMSDMNMVVFPDPVGDETPILVNPV